MSEFWMIKSLNQNLIPDDDVARGYLKRLKAGSPVLVDVKQPRNLKFHRKYFALLNLSFENQDKYDDFDAFRKEVIMRAGFYVEHIHVTGSISYTARSISFSKMDDMAFGDLYQKTIDAIIKYFIPGMEPDALDAAVMEVLSFA